MESKGFDFLHLEGHPPWGQLLQSIPWVSYLCVGEHVLVVDERVDGVVYTWKEAFEVHGNGNRF